ncbi:GAF domain-containing protein [Lentzea sp. NPDC004782]|uniref:GAF domain-containing protein n=1 Tax=Lentzea sp. NPDC004782 TaxID=3154458 RepID=UPI0033BE5EF8
MATAMELLRAHELFVCTETVLPFVRPVVADSWRRCVTGRASRDDHGLPSVWMGADELADHRAQHPLASALPVFDSLLGGPADDSGHVFAISDADGTLLWVRGRAVALERAERMNFVEGAGWSESSAGTNAPGTALVVGHPVQVFSAEHYNEVVHPWSCSAAPIRDPVSGRILGAVDITGDESAAGPYALALVRAVAMAAEAELAGLRRPVRPGVRIRALGRDAAVLEVDGHVRTLSPRHSEILVVLALAQRGLSAGRLAVELSEVELGMSTVRAEMSRLRAVLGDALLGSRPYALRRPVSADFTGVVALLAEGRVRDAMAIYDGPLLPSSDAPFVREYRIALEQQIRGAVLASGDVQLLRRWVSAGWGADDAAAWQALAAHLPRGSAAHGAAVGRARGLLVGAP